MRNILITSAGGSAAHNFIDALKIESIKTKIIGVDANKYKVELSNADVFYTIPRVDSTHYIRSLNKIIRKEKINFLHAQADDEVLAVSQNRNKIQTNIFLPDHKTILLARNKLACNIKLQSKSIPVPRSVIIRTKSDISTFISHNKTAKYWLRAIEGAGSRASIPIISAVQAEMWIDYWKVMKHTGYGEFMLSEYLPGKDFAFQSVWHNGRLIVSQARERLEYVFGNLTVSGQSSSPSIAKTVQRDDVNIISTNAVLAIDSNPHGIYCVDLKENERSIPCVTEINCGRFFTTSNFYAHAGVNMPYVYTCLALGIQYPVYPQYNPLPKDLYWIRTIDMGYKLLKKIPSKSKCL